MTETEWNTSIDPGNMLELLRVNASDRKLRLFAVACCRRVLHLLPNEFAQRVVTVAEGYADNAYSDDELAAVAETFRSSERERGPDYPDVCAEREAFTSLERLTVGRSNPMNAWDAAAEVSDCTPDALACEAGSQSGPVRKSEQVFQTHIICDIFGNPFCPVVPVPAWLTSTVVALAGQMYESRDFSPMPILADALQDAGCDNTDILDHCRGPGPHVRGCFVVDLLLGKE